MAGTFGYELDITRTSEEELEKMKAYNELYHKYNNLVREGDYYRIASYRENNYYDCWQCNDKEKTEALVTFVQVHYTPKRVSIRLRLKGLCPDRIYKLEETGEVMSGALLMQAGYLVEPAMGDYNSKQYHFVAI